MFPAEWPASDEEVHPILTGRRLEPSGEREREAKPTGRGPGGGGLRVKLASVEWWAIGLNRRASQRWAELRLCVVVDLKSEGEGEGEACLWPD